MKPLDVQFTMVHQTITVVETSLSFSECFHFRTRQNHSCIESVFDEILKGGGPVSNFHGIKGTAPQRVLLTGEKPQ